jgi:TRAP-type C4-dicarboxylate transport system substrate-binding protein
MRGFGLFVLVVGLALALGASQASAAGKLDIRVLAWFGNQVATDDIELPFWKKLEEATGGELSATVRTIDEVGLKGFDSLRTLQEGAFDILVFQTGFVSGDDPFFTGHDLPGVAPDFALARKAADAYREAFDKRLRKYRGRLLIQWPYPAQMVYCKGEVSGLADLKGKKIRVSSSVLAAMVKDWGAIAVSLPFSEVYTALQRGVADCALSGSLSGNTASWYEVSDTLYTLTVGWGLTAHAASEGFWNKLTAEQKDALMAQMKKLEDQLWDFGLESTQDGINCNAGKDPCKYGKKGKMTVVEASEADMKSLQQTSQKVVVPTWREDCERVFPECAAEWNSTVGKAVGMELK